MKRKSKKIKCLYLDSSQPIDKRVKDLLGRMTLKEKISQLGAGFANDFLENGKVSLKKAKKAINGFGTGVLHNIGKDPKQNIAVVNSIQKILFEDTRLGIPAIIAGEGLHGHMSGGDRKST